MGKGSWIASRILASLWSWSRRPGRPAPIAFWTWILGNILPSGCYYIAGPMLVLPFCKDPLSKHTNMCSKALTSKSRSNCISPPHLIMYVKYGKQTINIYCCCLSGGSISLERPLTVGAQIHHWNPFLECYCWPRPNLEVHKPATWKSLWYQVGRSMGKSS